MSEQHSIGRSEWSVYTGAWWKLLVAGPIIVVAVIVGSGAGIDAWFLGFFAVMLAFLSTAVGLMLGLAHLVALHRSESRA